jgi:hypothetical protein
MSSIPQTAVPARHVSNGGLDERDFLAGAAELVARGWSQRALARDREGRQVEPWSESARSWSPVGALIAILYERGGGQLDAFQVAYEALALATGGRVEEWNAARWRRRRHVLHAFDRARGYLPHARRRLLSGRSLP